jgi:hypothetical protein
MLWSVVACVMWRVIFTNINHMCLWVHGDNNNNNNNNINYTVQPLYGYSVNLHWISSLQPLACRKLCYLPGVLKWRRTRGGRMKIRRQVISQNEIHCLNRTLSTFLHALQQTSSGPLIIIHDFSAVLNNAKLIVCPLFSVFCCLCWIGDRWLALPGAQPTVTTRTSLHAAGDTRKMTLQHP